MPKSNVEELGYLGKLAGASDDLNMQISAKESIIDEKNKKIDSLKKELISLGDKIKNTDNLFRHEMSERIIKLENREADLKKREEQHDNIVRESEKYLKEQAQKNEIDLTEAYEIKQLADELGEKANNKYKEVYEEKKKIERIKSENEIILSKIAEEQVINARLIKEFESKTMNLELNKNSLKEQVNQLEEKIRISNEKIIKSAKQSVEAKNMEVSLDMQLKRLRDLERENTLILAEIETKKAELEIKSKAFDDKVRQTEIESDNNTSNLIALRAKEITLNEKERSLVERERNIKILEAKLKGG